VLLRKYDGTVYDPALGVVNDVVTLHRRARVALRGDRGARADQGRTQGEGDNRAAYELGAATPAGHSGLLAGALRCNRASNRYVHEETLLRIFFVRTYGWFRG
jgi:hypothetical protein